MKANELKAMREATAEEIQKRIIELKAELFNLRFQHATGQLENPMRIREVKKSIAQLKTIMREKELKAMGR
ncbi:MULTISPECIES: 50S ribosomal protein L29 [Caloramator]|jgi:large subunit ribosomal protein L29|uniref:Large ribosomal subunit protein uL29 n=1 Tax=Caloramator australicus RC3 TaxID=857293 RepID=I7KTY6_9CLOT|nr:MULTISPECIES: 50S ribosomal protein L29 [Caloramator]MDO6353786.1 50S ribosomal protein L29 [Caloramator sp. CAR-1]WDU83370.1 50S ribosomal protein L29 [Caloramator sp. Dgby_cultured_2]CCJ33303.1 LSU ribosomal protein L29p (L35e) [Caloramator australicus RC3]